MHPFLTSRRPAAALLSLLLFTPFASAGTYGPQNFNSLAVGATDAGGGTVMGGSINNTNAAGVGTIQNRPDSSTDRAVRLTYLNTFTIMRGSFKIPVLDPGVAITGFDASFKIMQYGPDLIADGSALTFGNLAAATNEHGSGELGFRAPGAGGLVISFDTYKNPPDNAPWIEIRYGDVGIANAPTPFNLNDKTFHTVTVHWDADGVDVTYDGVAKFTDVQVPGFVPAAGDQFAFSARTQGSDQETMFDDIQITTTTTVVPPVVTDVVISEFLADNGDGIEDEDADASDWIEIHNGNTTAANLTGWRLTNDAANLAMWTLPAVSVPANGYLRIFASGKNRTAPAGVLHTNFTLDKAGGYLALIKPDGTIKTSEFTYGQQSEDVSFGTYGTEQAQQYLLPPTPGAKNEVAGVLHADGPPAEEVLYSREGGLISGPVTLSVTPPVAAGAEVHYTEDGTIPDANDPVFPAAGLNITTTKEIRARVLQPGRLPGDVNSRTFLLLDSSVTSFGTTGQPFKSNLPIVVVEGWGVDIDGTKNPNNARPHRPVYTVVLGKDAGANNRAHLDGPVDFQGRGGMHVRGQSSSDFGQRSYTWETWTNEDDDKNVAILGMPSDSDWVLQSMFNDKTLMRNMLPYTLCREVSGSMGATRGQFVEVFFNQDGGPVSYADYRGVYVLNENIKRAGDRVDISKISALATDAATLSGGYIWKKDKPTTGGDFSTTSTQPWGTQNLWIVEPANFTATQTNALKGHLQAFDTALSGNNYTDPLLGYKAHIEPQSFMDNHLWVEVFKQIDGYWLSTYYTKDRGGKIRALPIWDYNLSSGNANYNGADQTNSWFYTGTGGDHYPYYPRLFQDPDFMLKYWDRYWQLRRSVFATNYMTGKMDGWVNELTDGQPGTNVVNGASTQTGTTGDFHPRNPANALPPSLESPARVESPIMRHFDRWPILGVYVWPNPNGATSRTTFQSEVQWMKDWLTNHMNWIDTQHSKPPAFSHGGGNVAAGTQLTITNPNSGTATIYYTTDGSDPSTAGTGGPVTTLIADTAAACKWLVPSAANGGSTLTAGAGAQQWTTYTDPPNIANWTTTTSAVGYDTGGGVDYLQYLGHAVNSKTETLMHNVNATCYLRFPFTIADQATLDSIATLTLAMRYDDGYRAYINGVAITGKNDTHASMTSSPSTAQATQTHDDTQSTQFESVDITTAGKPALRVGPNVLAIHGLNSSTGSSDFLMSPKLTFQAGGTGPRVYSGPLTLSGSTLVRARVQISGQWSPVTEASFVVNATPASAANLVVSEFAYDPPPSGNYTSKDLEFIVLRNIGAGSVDLSGVQFTSGVSFTLTGTPQQMTLPPGGEAVIAANNAALEAVHGAAPATVKLFGPFTGALSNDGEPLSIHDASGAVIKEFTYGIAAPWPAGAGTSLALKSPASNPDHNDGSQWRSGNPAPWSGDSVPFTGVWNADTDGDGFSDGIEYALGTDAGSHASVPLIGITTSVETPSNRILTLTFRRSLVNDRAAIAPELSTGLNTWQPNAFTRISSVQNGDGTVTEVWRSVLPVAGKEAFGRLRISAL